MSESELASDGGGTEQLAEHAHLPAVDAVEVGERVVVGGEPAVDGGGDVDDAALDAGVPCRLRHLVQQQAGEQEVA